MKVLFVGHGGCYNHGCEAIVRSTLLMLKKEYSDLQVVLASFDPEGDAKVDFGFQVKVIPGQSNRLWQKGTLDWFLAKFYRRLSPIGELELIYAPLKAEMKNADVVVSVGGDNYTEDYGDVSLRMYLDLNRFVKHHGKKLVVWGASIGPFKDNEKLTGIIKDLNLADLITVREEHSFVDLKRMGVRNIKRVADPAFLLPVSEVALPEAMQKENGLKVGFNISPLLKDYFKNSGEDFFRKESIKFLDELISVHKAFVVLLPHVNQPGGTQTNDYDYLNGILKELKYKNRAVIIPTDKNAEELKYILSQCDFFIGARTHATIGALSTQVPTLSIGYSRKSIGINEDLFGSSKYVLDKKDYSAVRLMEKFLELKNDRQIIKQRLSERLPEVKKMAWANMTCLKDLAAK